VSESVGTSVCVRSVCVVTCVCVCEREREREKEMKGESLCERATVCVMEM
jgi:hypothetical protein